MYRSVLLMLGIGICATALGSDDDLIRDQWRMAGHDAANSRNQPAEFTETRFPVLVEKLGLSVDSGGAGKRRGGLGYDKHYRALVDCHTIVTADLRGDGRDAIIAGFRGKPQRVHVYSFDGQHWQRQILDDGDMAAAACATADLNGDGRPDIACIGSATHNLKWYENLGPTKSSRP